MGGTATVMSLNLMGISPNKDKIIHYSLSKRCQKLLDVSSTRASATLCMVILCFDEGYCGASKTVIAGESTYIRCKSVFRGNNIDSMIYHNFLGRFIQGYDAIVSTLSLPLT
jgi:hypothetical protein